MKCKLNECWLPRKLATVFNLNTEKAPECSKLHQHHSKPPLLSHTLSTLNNNHKNKRCTFRFRFGYLFSASCLSPSGPSSESGVMGGGKPSAGKHILCALTATALQWCWPRPCCLPCGCRPKVQTEEPFKPTDRCFSQATIAPPWQWFSTGPQQEGTPSEWDWLFIVSVAEPFSHSLAGWESQCDLEVFFPKDSKIPKEVFQGVRLLSWNVSRLLMTFFHCYLHQWEPVSHCVATSEPNLLPFLAGSWDITGGFSPAELQPCDSSTNGTSDGRKTRREKRRRRKKFAAAAEEHSELDTREIWRYNFKLWTQARA